MNELFEKPPVRNISNSEVTSFLSCKRQYKYGYMLELQPKETGDPLARGSYFHYGMELYWLARLGQIPIYGDAEGVVIGYRPVMLHADAYDYALNNAFIYPNPDVRGSFEMSMNAQFLWVRYMTFHRGFPDVEPLGTEVKMSVAVTPTLNMSMKYDFYYRRISNNKYVILDYKLAYEFWKQDDHDLNGQMPKYVSILQANGYQVDEGELEEIRSRDLGKDKAADPKNLWKTSRYVPSQAKKASLLRQHIGASLQIEKFRALSPEELEAEALPVLNKHGACKYCNFTDLCIAELEGKKDLSVDIRHGYTQNTYVQQYNPTQEVTF